MKKIAILTSGGDSPGMNAAVYGAAKRAFALGMEIYAIYEGYKGLYEDNIKKLNDQILNGIYKSGGTNIYSARFPEFKDPKIREKAVKNLNKHGIEALIVVGGDGSFMGAYHITKIGYPAIGIPGTIDNDIKGTDFTLGFKTTSNLVAKSIDNLRNTATSHKRCFVVEIMGREAGDLPLEVALATDAEELWIKEEDNSIDKIVESIKKVDHQRSAIVCVSEFYKDKIDELVSKIDKATSFEVKKMNMGHLQRGQDPDIDDRNLGIEMGIHAVDLLKEGKKGRVIGLVNEELVDHEIIESIEKFERKFNFKKLERYRKV